MSKNMTRKGLAFGAGFALVSTGLVTMPAQAAGNINDNEVGLVPATGTQYGMLLDNVFDLKSTVSTSADDGTANLKWLVTDPDKELVFDYDGDTSTASSDDNAKVLAAFAYNDPASDTLDVAWDESAYTVTITNPVDEDAFADLAVGDVVAIAGLDSANIGDAFTGTVVVASVNANKDQFSFLAPYSTSFAGGTGTDDNEDIATEALSAGTITEAAAIPFNIGATSAGAADNLQVAFNDSTNVVTITNPQDNNVFARLVAGDVVLVSGMNSAAIDTAFTGYVTVVSVNANDDEFTFVADLDLVTAGNVNAQDLSAGTFAEASFSDALDSRAVIKDATLGAAGLTGLPVPTRAADGSFVINTNRDAVSTQTDILRLVSKSTDAHTVTVQAWVDANGDGTIDGTEDASSVRTVTFVPLSAAGAVVTVEQPIAGTSTWIANAAFGADINASQVTAGRFALGLGFIEAGVLKAGSSGSGVSGGAFTNEEALVYNSTANHWRLQTGSTAGVGVVANYTSLTDDQFNAGFTYVAELVIDGTPTGTRVYKSTASALATGVGEVVSTRDDNVKDSGSRTYDVRAKTTTLTASAKVTKDSGVTPVAGAPVEVTITRSVLDSKSTITAGGKTLTSTSTSSSISFASTTGADGRAVVEITNSQGKANDAITVTITHAGLTSQATTYTWVTPSDTGAEFNRDGNFTGSDSTDALAITKGASYTLNYNVFDEFGAADPTAHRVIITYTPIGTVAGAAQDQVVRTVNVSGASASFAITDTSTILGTYNVVAKLQKLNAATGNYDLGDADTLTTTVHVQADITPAKVTVAAAAAGTAALEAEDLVAVDLRADKNQDMPAYTDTGRYVVTGQLTNAAGVPIVGANVTISAPSGTAFEIGDAYTLGTATVTTDNTGSYSVKLFSQKGGKFNVTATAGAVSATTTTAVEFPAADTGTGASLVLDMPASVNPGSSFTVKATLVDKWGNPVAAVNGSNNVLVSSSYVGDGVYFGLPTQFNANGELMFNVLVGSNDSGTVTVTVRYDGDTTSTTNLNDITVSKSLVIGTAGNTGELATWTKKLTDGSAKMYAKNIVGEGKVQFFLNGEEIAWVRATNTSDSKLREANGSYYLVRTVEFVEGQKNVLEIYVDGVRTTRTAYTY